MSKKKNTIAAVLINKSKEQKSLRIMAIVFIIVTLFVFSVGSCDSSYDSNSYGLSSGEKEPTPTTKEYRVRFYVIWYTLDNRAVDLRHTFYVDAVTSGEALRKARTQLEELYQIRGGSFLIDDFEITLM